MTCVNLPVEASQVALLPLVPNVCFEPLSPPAGQLVSESHLVELKPRVC